MNPAEQRQFSPRSVGERNMQIPASPIKELMDSIITINSKGGVATSDGDDEDSDLGIVHPGSVPLRLRRTRNYTLNSSISVNVSENQKGSKYEVLEYLRKRPHYPKGPEIVTRLKTRPRRKKAFKTFSEGMVPEDAYIGLPTSSYEVESDDTTESPSDIDYAKGKRLLNKVSTPSPPNYHEVEVYVNSHEVGLKSKIGVAEVENLSSSIWEADSDVPITILNHEPSKELSNDQQSDMTDLEDGDPGFFIKPSVVAFQEMAWKTRTSPSLDDMIPEPVGNLMMTMPDQANLEHRQLVISEVEHEQIPEFPASPPPSPVQQDTTTSGGATTSQLANIPNDTPDGSSKGWSMEVNLPSSFRSDNVTVLSNPLAPHRPGASVPGHLLLSNEAETRLVTMRRFLSSEDSDSSLLDMKVSVQDKLFPVHRLLMAMYSQLFLELYLDHKLKPFCTVVIEGVTPEAFQCVLKWINTSILDLKMASLDDVLQVAYVLKIKAIVDKLEYLRTTMSLSSALRDQDMVPLYEHAIRHGLQDLSAELGRKAAASFPEVVRGNMHLDYTKEQLCLLLSRDDLRISQESDVFQAACQWLLHAWTVRYEYESQVMSCVRFKRMSPSEMCQLLLDAHNPLTKSHQVVMMMMHALLYRTLKAEGREIPSFLGRDAPARTAVGPILQDTTRRLRVSSQQRLAGMPRTRKTLSEDTAATKIQAYYRGHLTRRAMEELEDATITIQKVYRGHRVREDLRRLNDATTVVQSAFRRYLGRKQYDLLTSAASTVNAARKSIMDTLSGVLSRDQPWFRLPVMAAFICFGGVTTESNDVNVVEMTSHVYCYDKSSDTWMVCGMMPQPRAESSACVLGRRVYITGGYDPSYPDLIPVSTAWMLDLSTSDWVILPEMFVARRLHGQASVNGKIFVVGGCNIVNKALDSVEFYDPTLDAWTVTTPLEVPRFGAAVTAHKNAIWVCGGVAGYSRKLIRKITDRVDVYDPYKLKWIKFRSLPEPRAFCDLVSVNGSMLVMAGGIEGTRSGGIHVTSTVLAFDFYRNDWRHLLDLRSQRYKARTLFLDPYLIVIGGEKEISGPPLATIECFDMEDRQWIGIPQLPVALHGMCSVVVD